MADIEPREAKDSGLSVWVVIGAVAAGLALLALVVWLLFGDVFGSDADPQSGGAVASSTTSSTEGSTTTEDAGTTTTTEAPTTTSTTLPPIAWVDVPDSLKPDVTLLDPGQEPLETLVYSPSVGDSSTLVVQNGFAIDQSIDGGFASEVRAVTATEVTFTVIAVDGAGIVVENTFGDSTVEAADPVSQFTLEASYEQIRGLTTYTLVSPRGEVLATATDEMPLELTDFVQSSAGAVVPFPEEPIGRGAEWEVVSTIESGGITFIQTSRVRLVEIEGPHLSVEIETAQELGPDGLVLPGVETVEADVETSGFGTAIWDLATGFPVEASSAVDQEMTVTFSIDNQQGTLDQTTSVTLEMMQLPPPGIFDLWDIGEIKLVGDATRFVSHLRVTPSLNRNQAGAAWLAEKQAVADGFETSFRFRISGVEQNPGDGFAFVIQNTNDSALGAEGDASGIGYKRMPNSVAVEFDTTSHDYESDPSGNHIAVHTLGQERNTTHQSASLGSATPPFLLWDGAIHTVTIRYTPGTLDVFLDDETEPVLTVEIDLSDTLRLDGGAAFVGFTASTESGFREAHDILDWTFSSGS